MESVNTKFHTPNDDDKEVAQRSTAGQFLYAVRRLLIRPFLIGFAGSFGVSLGYATFDFLQKRWLGV